MNCPAKYEKWGGFAAAASSCASFDIDRQSDARLSDLFDKLDLLEQRCEHLHDFQTIANAMTASKVSPTDVSYLNSPLLDGLWKVVTGLDPDGVTDLLVDELNGTRRVLLRLLAPKPYLDTICFLGILNAPWSADLVVDASVYDCLNPVAVAAGSGRLELIRLMLQTGFLAHAGADYALSAAVENGHLDIVREILNAFDRSEIVLSEASRFNGNSAEVAASYGFTEMVFLFVRRDPFYAVRSAVRGACDGDHADLFLSLWTSPEAESVRAADGRFVISAEKAGPNVLKLLLSSSTDAVKQFHKPQHAVVGACFACLSA